MRPPGRRGRGLRRAGPGGRGGRVCVSEGGRGSGSEGWRRGLFARSRVPSGLCARPGTARGARGVRDCVRARACLWRGAAGCVSAYALGRHCACPGRGARGAGLGARGSGRGPAPVQSLLRGDVFQTGFLRRLALLQPQPEGGAPPPQASRDPGGPGTADRHLREGGGAHPGGVQRPARPAKPRWGD